MNLLIVLSLAVAVALFPPVLALPANIEPPSKDVDFDVFPESTDLDSLEQLAGNGTPDDTDDDYDIEARSPEAAAAFQCTLANLNKIMFNYSESHRPSSLTSLPKTHTTTPQTCPTSKPHARPNRPAVSTGRPTHVPSAPTAR
jgi:hypothetical protein